MKSHEALAKQHIQTTNTLNMLASVAANTAKKQGKDPHTYGQGIADILDKLSASLRELYHYYIRDDGEPEGYLVDLADVVIATLAMMYDFSLPGSLTRPTPGDVIIEKMKYNATRED